MRRSVLLLLLLGCSSNGGGTPTTTTGCRTQSDCDDNTACTRDRCLVGGTCENEPDNAACTAPQMCISGRGCAVPGARTCASASDCDDRVACTRDRCLVDQTCANTPQNEMCTTGQTCDLTAGCTTMATPTTCRTAGDCDDQIPCTEDLCGVDGRCSHVAQNARCGTGRTCAAGMGCIVEHACSNNMDCDDHLRCNGVETCSELACSAGTAADCNDNNPCTTDTCSETGEMCAHAMNPTCTATVRSGIYNAVTPVRYACTALGMPAVSLDIQYFQFAVSASSLVVTPGPMGTAMNGPPPGGANFNVTGMVAGTCTEIYSLTGMFTDATHFTATYTARFVDAFPGACALSTCTAQTFTVMGVAM